MTITEWIKAGFSKPTAPEWEEHSRVGDVSTGRAFKAVQIVPMKSVTGTNASLTFYGFAKPGTSTGSALWRIMAEDANGNITFADGNDEFDNVFTDHNTISFS